LQVFAIRHKPNGAFMPARMFKSSSGRGWSHWDPFDVGGVGYGGFDRNPRIFFTKASAQRALAAWLAGPWERRTGTDGDWESGYYTVDMPPAPGKASTPRSKGDMEIVPFELRET
jgi:hypothetical protein